MDGWMDGAMLGPRAVALLVYVYGVLNISPQSWLESKMLDCCPMIILLSSLW